MKNIDLTQQAYTAPSVRVVNVNIRQAILQISGEMDDENI